MLDSATVHEGDGGTKSQLLLVADESSAEHGLRSAIQTLERRGDASGGDLVTHLISLGKLTEEKGNRGEAESFFRRALEVGHGTLAATDPRVLPALTSLAGYHVLRDDFNDAGPLLSRALSIAERYAGDEQAEVAILLNDLARICLKQAAHALADPLLMRLLAIKESKGENHPEVATVLASLASVRQALGQHESAEKLWRRVLDIRERTLAPNHFSVATALERLAESCAARGKFDEALQLYQRAQPIRQLTLGNNHASLRISRDRIADLQLQLSEDGVAGPQAQPVPPVSPPDGFRLRFPADRRMISPVPFPLTSEPPSISVVHQANGSASLERSESRTVEPEADESLNRASASAASGVASYENILRSIAQELGDDDEYEYGEQPLHAREILTRLYTASLPHRQKLALAGVAVVAIALSAWAWNSTAAERAAQQNVEYQSPGTARPPVFVASAAMNPGRSPATASGSFNSPATLRTTTSSPATSKAAPASASAGRASAPERPEPPKNASDRKRDSKAVAIPKFAAPTMSHFDSMQKAGDVGTPKFGESAPIDLAGLTHSQQRLAFGNGEEAASRQRARLIGELPIPTVPAWLSSVVGEVVVKFGVDTEGRPIMSTFSVIKSPDVTLSEAVRKVISTLRFDAAEDADGKRVVDTVQVVYRFAPAAK